MVFVLFFEDDHVFLFLWWFWKELEGVEVMIYGIGSKTSFWMILGGARWGRFSSKEKSHRIKRNLYSLTLAQGPFYICFGFKGGCPLEC